MSKGAGFIGSIIGSIIGFAIINLLYSGTDAPWCGTLICGVLFGGLMGSINVTFDNPKANVVVRSIGAMLGCWTIGITVGLFCSQSYSAADLAIGGLGMAFVGLCSGLSFIAGASIGRKACGCG